MNIKERLKLFGIWVIRAIETRWRNKNVQRFGVMILGLGLMFGVSQASALRRAMNNIISGGSASAEMPTRQKPLQATASQPAVTTQSVTDASAETTVGGEVNAGAANIVDLIADSETIISGMVKEVTDGFENGLPYTEVTVEVSETLRGQVGEEYKFRQFGLKEPRKMDNGKVYVGVTPEGWSKYEVGENTMLFLHKAASVTGLRTTAGLGQGKVVFKGGNAVSQAGNDGLFENVDVDAKLLNDKDKRLLATKKGVVNADGFKSFVKRAVNGKWIEGGKMRHAKK